MLIFLAQTRVKMFLQSVATDGIDRNKNLEVGEGIYDF